MTNYERIKNMSKEDMTLFFCKGDYGCSGCLGTTDKTFCKEERSRVRTWLESESCTYGYARPLVVYEKPSEETIAEEKRNRLELVENT